METCSGKKGSGIAVGLVVVVGSALLVGAYCGYFTGGVTTVVLGPSSNAIQSMQYKERHINYWVVRFPVG